MEVCGINQFRCGHADMVGGNLLDFFGRGGNESTPGKVVGLPEESTGALVDGGNGGIGKKGMGDAGDLQMVVQVEFHIVSVDSHQMTASNDSGGQGQGGSIEEEIGQIVLSCQDDGQIGFGVAFELGDDVEFEEDFDP